MLNTNVCLSNALVWIMYAYTQNVQYLHHTNACIKQTRKCISDPTHFLITFYLDQSLGFKIKTSLSLISLLIASCGHVCTMHTYIKQTNFKYFIYLVKHRTLTSSCTWAVLAIDFKTTSLNTVFKYRVVVEFE